MTYRSANRFKWCIRTGRWAKVWACHSTETYHDTTLESNSVGRQHNIMVSGATWSSRRLDGRSGDSLFPHKVNITKMEINLWPSVDTTCCQGLRYMSSMLLQYIICVYIRSPWSKPPFNNLAPHFYTTRRIPILQLVSEWTATPHSLFRLLLQSLCVEGKYTSEETIRMSSSIRKTSTRQTCTTSRAFRFLTCWKPRGRIEAAMLGRFLAACTLIAGTVAAPSIILKKRDVTTLSRDDLNGLAPYTQFARATYCPTSDLKNWSCGGTSNDTWCNLTKHWNHRRRVWGPARISTYSRRRGWKCYSELWAYLLELMLTGLIMPS